MKAWQIKVNDRETTADTSLKTNVDVRLYWIVNTGVAAVSTNECSSLSRYVKLSFYVWTSNLYIYAQNSITSSVYLHLSITSFTARDPIPKRHKDSHSGSFHQTLTRLHQTQALCRQAEIYSHISFTNNRRINSSPRDAYLYGAWSAIQLIITTDNWQAGCGWRFAMFEKRRRRQSHGVTSFWSFASRICSHTAISLW